MYPGGVEGYIYTMVGRDTYTPGWVSPIYTREAINLRYTPREAINLRYTPREASIPP